jgi:hypothetical protein
MYWRAIELIIYEQKPLLKTDRRGFLIIQSIRLVLSKCINNNDGMVDDSSDDNKGNNGDKDNNDGMDGNNGDKGNNGGMDEDNIDGYPIHYPHYHHVEPLLFPA